MKRKIEIGKIYYSTERYMPVIGGRLYEGYKAIHRGDFEAGKKILIDFLVAVYASPNRRHEMTTKLYVDKVRAKMKLPFNKDKENEIIEIVRMAGAIQFRELMYPLYLSIVNNGYRKTHVSMIELAEHDGKLFVMDGKHRLSILGAIGEKYVPENSYIIERGFQNENADIRAVC